MNDIKTCTRCTIGKTANFFLPRKNYFNGKLGLDSHCKDCRHIVDRLRSKIKCSLRPKKIPLREQSNRICKNCGIEKDISEYSPKNYNTKIGKYSSRCNMCKSCNRIYMKAYRKTTRGKAQTKLSDRKKRLKFNYDLTIEQYKELLAQQNNKCAICYMELNNHPSTDHDHITKIVRGILCRECNLGLGMFKDSRSTLASAITYLSKGIKI